jgi:hypothetical protein
LRSQSVVDSENATVDLSSVTLNAVPFLIDTSKVVAASMSIKDTPHFVHVLVIGSGVGVIWVFSREAMATGCPGNISLGCPVVSLLPLFLGPLLCFSPILLCHNPLTIDSIDSSDLPPFRAAYCAFDNFISSKGLDKIDSRFIAG